jgi:3-hydroxyisobutyrate dehydrogenase-like beta-hydroxyacid dehydrogenase
VCVFVCLRRRYQSKVLLGVRTHAVASLSAKGLSAWDPLRRRLAQAPVLVVLVSRPRPRRPSAAAAKGLAAAAAQRAAAVELTRIDPDFPP